LKIQIVIDTNVLISGYLWSGNAVMLLPARRTSTMT